MKVRHEDLLRLDQRIWEDYSVYFDPLETNEGLESNFVPLEKLAWADAVKWLPQELSQHLQQKKYLAITGAPGMGKTQLARRICFEIQKVTQAQGKEIIFRALTSYELRIGSTNSFSFDASDHIVIYLFKAIDAPAHKFFVKQLLSQATGDDKSNYYVIVTTSLDNFFEDPHRNIQLNKLLTLSDALSLMDWEQCVIKAYQRQYGEAGDTKEQAACIQYIKSFMESSWDEQALPAIEKLLATEWFQKQDDWPNTELIALFELIKLFNSQPMSLAIAGKYIASTDIPGTACYDRTKGAITYYEEYFSEINTQSYRISPVLYPQFALLRLLFEEQDHIMERVYYWEDISDCKPSEVLRLVTLYPSRWLPLIFIDAAQRHFKNGIKKECLVNTRLFLEFLDDFSLLLGCLNIRVSDSRSAEIMLISDHARFVVQSLLSEQEQSILQIQCTKIAKELKEPEAAEQLFQMGCTQWFGDQSYETAKDLIEQALSCNPNRFDIRLALLGLRLSHEKCNQSLEVLWQVFNDAKKCGAFALNDEHKQQLASLFEQIASSLRGRETGYCYRDKVEKAYLLSLKYHRNSTVEESLSNYKQEIAKQLRYLEENTQNTYDNGCAKRGRAQFFTPPLQLKGDDKPSSTEPAP